MPRPSSGARADFLAPEPPWAALSQLNRRKISKVGWAHFCWHYLVSHPPIYIYKYGKKNTLHHLWEIYAALFGYIYQWKIPPNNVAQNHRLASGGWEC